MLGRRRSTPLEKRLGYRFHRPELLATALTHRSWAHESGGAENSERLEFLGDALLGLVAAEWLFGEHPDLPEGELSKRKAFLVSQEALAHRARDLGLGAELRLGVGEERSGGRDKASLLADAVEAVLAAIYLDGGMEPARRVIEALLEEGAPERAGSLFDAKARLQELAQARGWELPEYALLAAEGPDHARRFTVECRVRGEAVGAGGGRSKKGAEQRAAAAALRRLEAAGDDAAG